MPTYDWTCDKCNKDFVTITSISEYTGKEKCPECSELARRVINFSQVQFIGTRVEDAVFDPAFGKIIKSSRHRKDEAKARGWVEVGNEKLPTVHKEMEGQLKENLSWDKVKV